MQLVPHSTKLHESQSFRISGTFLVLFCSPQALFLENFKIISAARVQTFLKFNYSPMVRALWSLDHFQVGRTISDSRLNKLLEIVCFERPVLIGANQVLD